jgi:ribosome-associated protein
VEIRDYALLAAEAAAEKKATDIVVLDVAGALVITDYFVLATGANDLQVKAIAEEMEHQVERAGLQVRGREGEAERKWILIDFGDLVVHVFQAETREFYRLEKLWGDVPRLELPESVTGPVVVKIETADDVAATGSEDAEDAS